MAQILQKKAIYNLILINLKKVDPSQLATLPMEEWQIINYRSLTQEDLFERLTVFQLPMNVSQFEALTKNYDTPEQMCQALERELKLEEKECDRLFLILFELWRRLCPDKCSPSIFGDSLDDAISRYEEGGICEEIQSSLASLQVILEENTDEGIEAQEAFEWIQSFCAQDLESFLYNYILDRLEEGNYDYAKELLEGFYRYMKESWWFDYLKARQQIHSDPRLGFTLLEKVIGEQKSKSNFDLLFEILSFLSTTGNHSLFHLVAQALINSLEIEEELLEFGAICSKHYHHLKVDAIADEIELILNLRPPRAATTALSKLDQTWMSLKRLLSQKVHITI